MKKGVHINVREWISLQINTYTNDLIFIYSYLKLHNMELNDLDPFNNN